MSDFSNAQIGDKVSCILNGTGQIVRFLDKIYMYPIKCKFDSGQTEDYTFCGKVLNTNINSALFYLGNDGRKYEYRPVQEVKFPYYVQSIVGNTYKVLNHTEANNIIVVKAKNKEDLGKFFTRDQEEIPTLTETKWTEEEFYARFGTVPWDLVPIDTKVIINGTVHRHYAGDHSIYRSGKTSFTNEGTPLKRADMVLAEDVTINGRLYTKGEN